MALRSILFLQRNVHRIPMRSLCDESFSRLNIYKDPAQAPKELPDDAYPEWLWRLKDPQPTREELLREAQGHYDRGGFDAIFDNMEAAALKRLFRLDARMRIKDENDRRRGGQVV